MEKVARPSRARLEQWSIDDIRADFSRPDPRFGMLAFWVLVGDVTTDQLIVQLDEMCAQGVPGAVVVTQPPFQTGFMTKEWWDLILPVVRHAKAMKFVLWINTEFSHPAGEGRTVGPEGPVSRTLIARPESLMHRLALTEVSGVAEWKRDSSVEVAVLVRTDSADRILETVEITAESTVLSDNDRIFEYRLEPSVGIDGGLVDLMSPEATEVYIGEVLEPLFAGLEEFIPETVQGFYIDHEGSYGSKIAWTPSLFDSYEDRFGERLEPLLPYLGESGLDGRGVEVRCKYFDHVGHLYGHHFFGKLTEWCAQHGLTFSGHVFEESQQLSVDHVADLFRVMSNVEMPAGDSLFEWGRSPRQVKDLASIATASGKGLFMEANQVLGADSYLDLERLRPTTSAMALWGITCFAPVVQCADMRIAPFGPFAAQQPWFRYYHLYEASVRRASFVNSVTHPAADVVVLYPKESMWGSAWPLFEPHQLKKRTSIPDPDKWGTSQDDIFASIVAGWKWGNRADADDLVYASIMETLTECHVEFLSADSQLVCASAASGRVSIGSADAHVVVVPPLDVLTLATATALRDFHRAGGQVVFVERLAARADNDAATSEVLLCLGEIVDGGSPIVQLDQLPDVMRRLGVAGEIFASSSDTQVRTATRQAADGRIVAVGNLGSEPCVATLSSHDGWELWDADTGRLSILEPVEGVASIALDSGAIRYLVRAQRPTLGSNAEGDERRVDFPQRTLRWSVEPVNESVPIRRLSARPFEITSDGSPAFGEYQEFSLRPESAAVRDWWIIARFPNPAWSGLTTAFGPELSTDLEASYEGLNGRVSWQHYESPTGWVNLDLAVDPDSGVGMFNEGAVGYALTWIESFDAGQVQLRLAADTCVDVWVGGRHVHRFWSPKKMVEPTDEYSQTVKFDVEAGRTPLLIKVTRLNRAYLGGMGFIVRLLSTDGRVRLSSSLAVEPPRATAPLGGWQYQFVVPPGVGGFHTDLNSGESLTVDGVAVPHTTPTSLVPGQVVVVTEVGSALRTEPFHLISAETDVTLGSISTTSLRDYVGQLKYRTTFDAPDLNSGERIELDLGLVGVVAEVIVNGSGVGVRAWRPFTFDITAQLRPGPNELTVIVTNTAAAERAALPEFRIWHVPTSGPKLDQGLHRNGLLGPVRLVRATTRESDSATS